MFSDVVDWVSEADDDALLMRLREIEGRRREDTATEAALLAELEHRKAYRADAHATMYGLLRSALHWSDAECRQRMQIARLVDAHPDVGDSLAEHQASVANVAAIARGHANQRVGDQILDEIGALLRSAEIDEYDTVQMLVREWEQRADTGQAHETTQSRQELRNAHSHVGLDGGELVAEFGLLDAIAVKEILDQYVDAEWHADWDATVEQYGADAGTLLMPRTDAQRRADAVVRVFLDAAATPPGAKRPEAVVNVHIDHHTFQDLLVEAELLPERTVDPFDDPTPHISQRMCRTEHGHPVDPRTVLQLLLAAHVRFVIRDDDGIPIHWGRTKRLFEGAARDAVRSLSTRCTHPGCRVPTTRTQTDHTIDYQLGGSTDPGNGNPRCLRHNLIKNRGFSVQRDRLGRWHTYRPDGTEVA